MGLGHQYLIMEIKKIYESPSSEVMEVLSEGVFCTSETYANESLDEVYGIW